MLMIIPASAVGLSLLLCVECAYNWEPFGGPPPDTNESLAFDTVPTLEPTPRWARRIKEFLKRNRPRHCVEMLAPDNLTALVEQHKEIKANMTKDPTWVWKKYSELEKLKGTTINRIGKSMENFTFPDMSIPTYDCSKTDEKFNEYIDNCKLETDYDKLQAKYDPYDLLHNKSVDWGEPTFDDEEFDKFVQERIGRLLISVYKLLGVGNLNKKQIDEVLETVDTITNEIFRHNKHINTNIIFKHYFLDNVRVASEKLEEEGVISTSFAKLIERLVKQFRRLDLNQIENVLVNLVNHYETIINLVNTLLVGQTPSKETIGESVESFVQTVVNPLMSWRYNGKNEVNLGKLETLLKPVAETYDHSVELNVIDNKNKVDVRKHINHDGSLREEQWNNAVDEKKERANIKQINNIINIFINHPSRSHRKNRRSVTTTYLPPWDPKKHPMPSMIPIPGLSVESFNPIDDFQIKRREAYEQHMKRKMWLPNNNSQSSFIFETFEYENPNKTRRSAIARQKNIEKIKGEAEARRNMRKGNKTYEAIYEARRQEHRARQQNQGKQQNANKQSEQKHAEKKERHKESCKIEKVDIQTRQTDEPKTKGWTLQDITNVDCWFREADIFYSRLSEEQPQLTTTSGKFHDRKVTIDESYERYKRRKERRRKHKELSRRRYESSDDRSRSRSCKHCDRRRRKNRKYRSSESDYTESESSRRERRRRRRKYRQRSDSSDSSRRHRRYQSSESRDSYASSKISEENRRNKQKRSYDEATSTTSSTSSTTRKTSTTQRKSTKPLDDAVDAEDEPSMTVEDVPSHELTSWHFWKDWSLFYFMHQNISLNISMANMTTNNIWRTTWPWTTKKKRITKWRHPNVSWPPMSEDSDSRSSQDSYDWGSGQSWMQNNKRELKSVEHFVRDNLFSEINEAAAELQQMNRTYSDEENEKSMDDSENLDKMADFSARYRVDFRKMKAREQEKEREYQKWSLSGGNYSTTTEYDWEIKVTKNLTLRSFRKGGHDVVFDISGLTLDPMSIEQIEKNLDADYLWKYGKNRTKTSTIQTTAATSTTATSTTTTTTQSTTKTEDDQMNNQQDPLWEDGTSIIDSAVEKMTSKEKADHIDHFERNFNQFDQGEHHMFAEPVLNRMERDVENKHNIKTMIKQILGNKMSVEDFYVKNKKPKMLYLHEIPQLSPSEIRKKELCLQSEMNGFLQDTNQCDQLKNVRNIPQRFKRAIGQRVKRALVPGEKTKYEDQVFHEKDFNQEAHPEHPIFYLTEEDLETKRYKTYNASFINDKLHEYIDDMFEELKLNHDTSEEEKRANSIYYRKYLEKRTTEFFRKLQEVIEGDDKRAVENFTYPPNYDFGSASVRDPKKEPYLMKLQQEYEEKHAKSFEEMERDIKLAKAGKLCTKQLREEAEAHVRGLPDDDQ